MSMGRYRLKPGRAADMRGKGRGGELPQYAVEFNNSSTVINCGSDASLDDLQAAAFTAEAWVMSYGAGYDAVIGQNNAWAGNGWELVRNNAVWTARINTDGGFVSASCTVGQTLTNTWQHVAVTYDNLGDRTMRLWIDGVFATTVSQTATTPVKSAASSNLSMSKAGNILNGKIAWARLSNVVRYAAGFTPPAIDAPPAVDANTVEQWNLNEGTGATAAAEVNAVNNGAITDGTWVAL